MNRRSSGGFSFIIGSMAFNATALQDKSRLNRVIREFFDDMDYLEADSPVLAETPIPESHIELFRTERRHADGSSSPMYLLPSPELWLKKLLAAGAPSLYQIGKCFRNGEQLDRWHRLEFTMLEWYALESSADDNITVMENLLGACTGMAEGEMPARITAPFRIMTMEESFNEFAGFSLEKDLRDAGLADHSPSDAGFQSVRAELSSILGVRLAERGLPAGSGNETPDDLFHRLFLTLVEEQLPADAPLVLKDWPQLVPTLARRVPGTPWAERWELYLGGVEVANCYGEENSLEELETYWRSETALVSADGDTGRSESDWPVQVAKGMPSCSGAAVGLDRLLALVRGDEDLRGLDLFPIHDMIRR